MVDHNYIDLLPLFYALPFLLPVTILNYRLKYHLSLLSRCTLLIYSQYQAMEENTKRMRHARDTPFVVYAFVALFSADY